MQRDLWKKECARMWNIPSARHVLNVFLLSVKSSLTSLLPFYFLSDSGASVCKAARQLFYHELQ